MEVRLQKDQATKATLEVVHRPLEGIGGMSHFHNTTTRPKADLKQPHLEQLNLVYLPSSHLS
jgi:hypothetical protein